MLYIIDHNDSFTHNLAAQIQQYCEITIINVEDLGKYDWSEMADMSGLVLSPGPKGPEDYRATKALFQTVYQRVPIIGVCLGHQMIASYLGGTIIKGEKPIQGFVHKIMLKADEPLFQHLQSPLMMTRYHSLCVQTLPTELEAIGWSEDGVIQIIKHINLPIYGVQFHPESCGSADGNQLIQQILKEAQLCD